MVVEVTAQPFPSCLLSSDLFETIPLRPLLTISIEKYLRLRFKSNGELLDRRSNTRTLTDIPSNTHSMAAAIEIACSSDNLLSMAVN